MIEITDLSKKFKRRVAKKRKKYQTITAVDNINLKIKKGEIFGLIGPNGAGKTTTLKILSTLIYPDSGTATINGYDIVKDSEAVKREIGLLAGEFSRCLYWRISGRENLKFFAKLNNIWKPNDRIDELVELFKLQDCENELVMKYSTGMKHKLVLARGLLTDPPVLFLDEPLTGIDPVTTYEIKKIIRKYFKEKTIIWASHNLYEIEEMCDRIGIINQGKIINEGEPDKLKRDYWDHSKILVYCNKPEVYKDFKGADVKGECVEISTDNIQKTIEEIIQIAKKENVKIKDINTLKPTLEEIFMNGVNND